MQPHIKDPVTIGFMRLRYTPAGVPYFVGRLGPSRIICRPAKFEALRAEVSDTYALQLAETTETLQPIQDAGR